MQSSTSGGTSLGELPATVVAGLVARGVPVGAGTIESLHDRAVVRRGGAVLHKQQGWVLSGDRVVHVEAVRPLAPADAGRFRPDGPWQVTVSTFVLAGHVTATGVYAPNPPVTASAGLAAGPAGSGSGDVTTWIPQRLRDDAARSGVRVGVAPFDVGIVVRGGAGSEVADRLTWLTVDGDAVVAFEIERRAVTGRFDDAGIDAALAEVPWTGTVHTGRVATRDRDLFTAAATRPQNAPAAAPAPATLATPPRPELGDGRRRGRFGRR